MGKKLAIAVYSACTLAFVSPLEAQTLHHTSGAWRVLTTEQSGSKVCYIASEPTKQTGNYKNRGNPYILVTHRNADTDEVSISSGYPYKSGSEVAVTVDGAKHSLFTKDNLAWAYDTAQDNALVSAMKKGSRMEVRGTSQKSTYSVDTYSLSGFTGAHRKMKELCK